MTEDAKPLKARHYIGWFFLGLTLIPLIIVSLYLHMKEESEFRMEQDATRWQASWSQLKPGMSKEEVLALVGAPNSTTVLETKATSVTTDPPDEKIEKDVQQSLEQEQNIAIWSYYSPIVIHTRPGEDSAEATHDGEIQLKELTNLNPETPLHGHAIKFNAAGEIVEISPK